MSIYDMQKLGLAGNSVGTLKSLNTNPVTLVIIYGINSSWKIPVLTLSACRTVNRAITFCGLVFLVMWILSLAEVRYLLNGV